MKYFQPAGKRGWLDNTFRQSDPPTFRAARDLASRENFRRRRPRDEIPTRRVRSPAVLAAPPLPPCKIRVCRRSIQRYIRLPLAAADEGRYSRRGRPGLQCAPQPWRSRSDGNSCHALPRAEAPGSRRKELDVALTRSEERRVGKGGR